MIIELFSTRVQGHGMVPRCLFPWYLISPAHSSTSMNISPLVDFSDLLCSFALEYLTTLESPLSP
jgi:hypothetical protein